MKFINRHLPTLIIIIGTMISLWFFMANLQQVKPALYAFALCIIIFFGLAISVLNKKLLQSFKRRLLHISRLKYFTPVVLISVLAVGLMARLFFYIRFTYSPVSDPMTFYESAKIIAAGGSQSGNTYVAFQPYLSGYNNALGEVMNFVSNPWIATILLNTFFDVLGAFAIFILLKKILKPGSHLPLLGFTAWVLSPLNIVFSVISIPVIIVNFFVIITILISYLLIKRVSTLQTRQALFASVVLGLTMGLGNCFRPIFIIAIIALALVFIFIFITQDKTIKFLSISMGCLLLTTFIFVGIQRFNTEFVSRQTGLPAAKSPSGWSMYVGSTWESAGEWRPYHNDNMAKICADSISRNDFDECHEKLQDIAIEQYRDYGIAQSASLFVQKLYHQAEEQNYFYNAEHSIIGYTESRTYKLINVYSVLYLLALFIMSAKFLYDFAKKTEDGKDLNLALLFMVLLMIGWFFAFMFVESAPRYSTVLYPIFTVFSVMAFHGTHTVKRRSK